MFQQYLAYILYKLEEFFVLPFIDLYININKNVPICIKEYDLKTMQVYTVYKPWIINRLLFGKYLCPDVKCSRPDIITSIEYVNGTHKLIKNSFEEKTETEHYVYINLNGHDISRFYNYYSSSFTKSNQITFKDFLCVLFLQNHIHVKLFYAWLINDSMTLTFISSKVEEKTIQHTDILQ